MMLKVIEAGSWDGPGMELPAQLIKVSSRGLIGTDRSDFLEKRAAAPIFADRLARVKLGSGDIPIHLVAIGATEAFGPNRNGDGFKEATCREVHDTFVKHARLYKNHQNKNPKKSFGKVALSAYNEPMRRIELLVIGNGTKEAADRNGGLVMDKRSIDRLSDGEFLPFSMACKVAYDVCNNCFNKAANRSLYCTADTCISPGGRRMFGCRDGLTKVSADGLQQYVENPGAMMFDISEVIRPADRIAYGGQADYMHKAASDLGHTPGGAELAEWWAKQGADFDPVSPETAIFRQELVAQLKLARVLADFERGVEEKLAHHQQILSAQARGLDRATDDLDLSVLGTPGSEKFASSVGALSAQKILLPLPAFLKLATGESGEKVAELSEKVSRHLPGVFGRLVSDPGLELALQSHVFAPSRQTPSVESRNWAQKQAAAYSLDTGAVRDRAWRSAIRNAPAPQLVEKSAMIKTAAADGREEKLARQYATYQLSFLTSVPQSSVDFRDLCELAVVQNYLSS